MKITEVRIKLMDSGEDRLRGFCSVTFDDAFVVRDLKIIEGNNGPFVAMPSRKLTSTCSKCRTKNHLRSNYCNNCGKRQPADQVSHDSGGRAKLYADIAHPVNAECREMIQSRVILELEKELARSNEPGYYSRYDDGYDGGARSSHAKPANKTEQPKSEQSQAEQSKEESPKSESDSEPDSADETLADLETVTRADSSHPAGQNGTHSPGETSTSSVEERDSPPDNPNISSGRSKPATEEFGKGIFD